MSGHNKWSTIKHKKGAADAKRSKIFTKIIREITVATKLGGADLDANPRLRLAVNNAKSANMPADNIKRAIEKGLGDDKSNWENITYEGYGPHNIAVIVECLTDNRNRTVSSVRTLFNKNNGNLGSSNSVLYMFDRKGQLYFEETNLNEDEITELALEAGAEDVIPQGDNAFTITTDPADLNSVSDFFTAKEIPFNMEYALIPQTPLEINDTTQAEQILKFIDILEDDDDVQNVFTNLQLSDEVTKQLEEES